MLHRPALLEGRAVQASTPLITIIMLLCFLSCFSCASFNWQQQQRLNKGNLDQDRGEGVGAVTLEVSRCVCGM